MPTWDSAQYLQFARERTQPAADLAARIAIDMPQRMVDLGCGPGNSTAVLAQRWPQAELTGIDNSEAMLETARREFPQWAGRASPRMPLVSSYAPPSCLHVFADLDGVIEWYRGTGLRPWLEALPDERLAHSLSGRFPCAPRTFPTRADGRVPFPFRRLFVIAYR
jgi:trans-aconitate methyltransferase